MANQKLIPFKFDPRLLTGDYSALYFLKTKTIAEQFKADSQVTFQFFQRCTKTILCGVNEVLGLLDWGLSAEAKTKVKVKALADGMKIKPGEPVLEITGPYQAFGYLEGVIDGILARQTSIATNAATVKAAAGKKAVMYMADRADIYLTQSHDGYAAAVGGLDQQITIANYDYHSGTTVGSIPHALIQMFDGDVVAALKAYHQCFPNEKLTALVDFNADVIGDSVRCVQAFGSLLTAVRVDTPFNVVDHFFDHQQHKLNGVNPPLIKALRNALDQAGGTNVKIIISSGLTPAKIIAFEKANAPVDIYGVGAYLLKINRHFTADAVLLDGKPLAKAGRSYIENPRLKPFLWTTSNPNS